MHIFPQLETRANGQFPIRRRIVLRTASTEQPDGSFTRIPDPDAAAAVWELVLNGLSGAEATAIEELFVAVEGPLGSFTFLDPFDNLLHWSDDLAQEVWQKDAGVELTAGIDDPFGGNAGFAISGIGEISQVVQAPAGLHYCLSAYVRGHSEVELIGRAGPVDSRRSFRAGPRWKRIEHSFRLGSSAESMTVALNTPGALDIFGVQLDAQAGASAYKPAASRAGVYNNARFADDFLGITTEGPDSHSCRLRVRAALD